LFDDDMTIPGLKLIRHNSGRVNNPDDPTLPFRLDASFRPPEFMQLAHIILYGNEEICVRGINREALDQFVAVNNLKTHPRLLRLEITEPEKAQSSNDPI
jgi:hypothetical protein